MALSVLQISPDEKGGYCLYDSATKKAFLKGGQEDMFLIKHTIEEMEQIKDNKEHLDKLKNDYIKLLVDGGHTKTEAIDFLKKQMPFLWT